MERLPGWAAAWVVIRVPMSVISSRYAMGIAAGVVVVLFALVVGSTHLLSSRPAAHVQSGVVGTPPQVSAPAKRGATGDEPPPADPRLAAAYASMEGRDFVAALRQALAARKSGV